MTPKPLPPELVTSDPYADARWELEVWRQTTPIHAWRGRLTLTPNGFGLPMTYGNEYTGLIYGWTHDSIVRKANRAVRRLARSQERSYAEVIDITGATT